jgi:hypothetical protein
MILGSENDDSGLQGPVREKDKRGKERNELRDLVTWLLSTYCRW